MKRWFWMVMMSMALFVGQAEAAKRFGGGKSIGQQSSNVTQRQAAPTQAANTTAATKNPAAPAAAAPKRPWGAMLGGLAAGLGLAWLASSLGLGEEMAQFMMFALLALVIMMAVGWFMRSRRPQTGARNSSPFAFQGAGSPGQASAPASYRPENVGNDASARPWERSTTAFDSANTASGGSSGSMIGSGLTGSQSWGIPAGFDTDGFLKSAKANFTVVASGLGQGRHSGAAGDDDRHHAQGNPGPVGGTRSAHGWPSEPDRRGDDRGSFAGHRRPGRRLHGQRRVFQAVREEPSAGPSPFREVWNMIQTQENGRSGWLVAGVQALQ